MLSRVRVLAGLAAITLGWSFDAHAQTVAQLQVAPSSVQVELGGREGVLVTAYDRSGNVVPAASFQWTSSNEAVARVEPDAATPNIAYVVGLAAGQAQLTVIAGAGAARAVVTVIVLAAAGPSGVGQAVSLEIVPNPILLLPTEELALQTRFLRADGQLAARGQLTWRSLLEAVAAVDQRGSVIGISAGQGVIQATSATGIVSRVVVQVANEGFRLGRERLSVAPAEADSITVLVPGQMNRPVTSNQLRWASTNGAVASVSPSGVVTGISTGTAEIVIQGFGQQLRMPVTVHRRVTSMEISPRHDEGPVFVPLTGTVRFEAVMLDASDTPVAEALPSWTVEDPSIVSFDQATGTATGLRLGSTRLTMRGPSRLEVTWDIRVVGGAIALEQSRVGLSLGSRVTLPVSHVDVNGAALAPADGLTWTTQSVDVATVDGSGTVLAMGWGRTQIIASSAWGAADTLNLFVQGQVLVTKFPGGDGDIYAFDPVSVAVQNQITSNPGTEIAANYSPDGTRIAYVATTGEGLQKIWVMDADGANPQMLTDRTEREGSPAWTPDGNQIVFESSQDIWIMNADGSNPRQITFGEATEDRPAVSPDGTTIAYQSTTGSNSDIYAMAIDGTDQRAVVATEALETFPEWFPDGRLAFASAQGTGRNRVRVVMRTDLATGAMDTLTTGDPPVVNFTVSGDGNTLVITADIREEGNQVRKLFVVPLLPTGAGAAVEVPRASPSEQYFFPSFKR